MTAASAAGHGVAAETMIGHIDDFPHDTIKSVEIAGRTIGVVRSGDKVYAFANRCPHHGAPMCSGKITGTMLPADPDQYVYGLDGLVIRCPWHAYEFNLNSGESIGNIMKARLLVYQTEVRGDAVYCRLVRVPSPGGASSQYSSQPKP